MDPDRASLERSDGSDGQCAIRVGVRVCEYPVTCSEKSFKVSSMTFRCFFSKLPDRHVGVAMYCLLKMYQMYDG